MLPLFGWTCGTCLDPPLELILLVNRDVVLQCSGFAAAAAQVGGSAPAWPSVGVDMQFTRSAECTAESPATDSLVRCDWTVTGWIRPRYLASCALHVSEKWYHSVTAKLVCTGNFHEFRKLDKIAELNTRKISACRSLKKFIWIHTVILHNSVLVAKVTLNFSLYSTCRENAKFKRQNF